MRWHRWLSGIAVIAMLIALVPAGNSFAAVTPSNGTMIAASMTLPRGAVFLMDGLGGHWWVSDGVQGICRLDANAAAPGGFQKGTCNGTVKSGGQIVVGDTPTTGADGSKFVYVADDASKSNHVVRFRFTPGAAGQAGSVSPTGTWNITNQTQKGGGGTGLGRPVALALTPHPGGGQDLYVGYLKSGDIERIDNPQNVANNINNPPYARVGSTSDGIGVNAFVMFGNDLYITEIGGLGMSWIHDPSGITRPACSATAVCNAVSLSPNPTFAGGGLATDWTSGSTAGKFIFIGNAPLGGAQNNVLRYDPATGTTEVYSQNVSPSYVSGGITYSTYVGPLGLGYNPITGDLFVGDDPQFAALIPVTNQGHIWKVPLPSAAPTVTALAPTSNPDNTTSIAVTITGTGFNITAGATAVNFGATPAASVTCASTTSCTAFTPIGLLGTVDVTVIVGGLTSAISPADQFTFFAPPPASSVSVSAVAPNSGATTGGTNVTITGSGFSIVAGATTIRFGANQATNVVCTLITQCTATSPAGAAGPVDVQVTVGLDTSPANPLDVFTYKTPTATLYAWGITAPKGGAVWLPGNLGGHWWSSDHSQGLCRQDPVPGTSLHAINFAVCGDDLVGSAGQAVYDPRANLNGTHYVYVPDNAVKSTAVWRLTFDPVTETMVPDPAGGAMATAMATLADLRTLKPNGMALGPDNNLYITDLVEKNVRKLTNPAGDPRTQVVSIVAETGDGRGANGTQGFIGPLLYISGNRAAQFFDIFQCPLLNPNGTTTPCGMASVPAPTGIFVAGTAVDATHKLVYVSSSPGGANATIYRYDASKDVYVAFPAGSVAPDLNGVVTCPACTVGSPALIYITGGNLPGPTTPDGSVWCAVASAASASSPATIGCQRPWDQTNHPTALTATTVPATFAFVFGLGMDPLGNLAITEDPSAGARAGRGTMWTVPYIP